MILLPFIVRQDSPPFAGVNGLIFRFRYVLNPIQWKWIKTENQSAYCKLQD